MSKLFYSIIGTAILAITFSIGVRIGAYSSRRNHNPSVPKVTKFVKEPEIKKSETKDSAGLENRVKNREDKENKGLLHGDGAIRIWEIELDNFEENGKYNFRGENNGNFYIFDFEKYKDKKDKTRFSVYEMIIDDFGKKK